MPKLLTPSKSLEEREIDVMEAIAVLAYLPKYPADHKQLKFICRMLALFMETGEINHHDPEKPKDPAALGMVNPMQWTIDQVGQTCYSFPPPIKFRRVYYEKFTPLDGKEPDELERSMED